MDLNLHKTQKTLLGLIVLILLDIIWISSTELMKHLYQYEAYKKPFFSTYFKSLMFSLYLLGFLFWPPWREIYCRNKHLQYIYLDLESSDLDEDLLEDSSSSSSSTSRRLSTPIFIPCKERGGELSLSDNNKSSGTESENDSSLNSFRTVRFNKVVEVRHLLDIEAADALLARLSYQSFARAKSAVRKSVQLPISQLLKISLIYSLLWFSANYTYQAALVKNEAEIVTIIFSTLGFFTLILSAFYPSCNTDKLTVSKCFAVILSFIGIVISSLHIMKLYQIFLPLLLLFSAFLYSLYLVLLKRTIQNKGKINLPLLFGFIGLFNLILLWPTLLFLHVAKIETFEWPSKEQLIILVINGLMGTVIFEILWIWACFLTSTLMATVALSLTIPIKIFANVLVKNATYPLIFYLLGLIPLLLGFFMIAINVHLDNWDPILLLIKSFYGKFHKKTQKLQYNINTDKDLSASEQRECLMESINND